MDVRDIDRVIKTVPPNHRGFVLCFFIGCITAVTVFTIHRHHGNRERLPAETFDRRSGSDQVSQTDLSMLRALTAIEVKLGCVEADLRTQQDGTDRLQHALDDERRRFSDARGEVERERGRLESEIHHLENQLEVASDNQRQDAWDSANRTGRGVLGTIQDQKTGPPTGPALSPESRESTVNLDYTVPVMAVQDKSAFRTESSNRRGTFERRPRGGYLVFNGQQSPESNRRPPSTESSYQYREAVDFFRRRQRSPGSWQLYDQLVLNGHSSRWYR